MPEQIVHSDGATNQECDLNAAKDFFRKILFIAKRTDYPYMTERMDAYDDLTVLNLKMKQRDVVMFMNGPMKFHYNGKEEAIQIIPSNDRTHGQTTSNLPKKNWS